MTTRFDGYTDQVSYAQGETIQIHLSCDLVPNTTDLWGDEPVAGPPTTFTLTIFRVGKFAEQCFSQTYTKYIRFPLPNRYSITSDGSVDGTYRYYAEFNDGCCGWPPSVWIDTPDPDDPAVDPSRVWRPGYYSARATIAGIDPADIWQSEIWFVIRAKNAGFSKLLLQLSANTYHAYNTGWPGKAEGESTGASGDAPAINSYDPTSYNMAVSFDRPLRCLPLAEQKPGACTLWEVPPLGQLADWHPDSNGWPVYNGSFYSAEWPFIRWLETETDFTVDYAVNSDLEWIDLSRYDLIITAGHDEYWSARMRDQVEEFIAGGGNAAFFAGNVSSFQVRFANGRRTMICYKQKTEVPADPTLQDKIVQADTAWTANPKFITGFWSSAWLQDPASGTPGPSNPETFLTGVGTPWGGFYPLRTTVSDGIDRPDKANQGQFTVYHPEFSEVFAGVYTQDDINAAAAGKYPTLGDSGNGPTRIIGFEVDGCDTDWSISPPVPSDGVTRPDCTFTILASAVASYVDDSSRPPDGITDWPPPPYYPYVSNRYFGTQIDDQPNLASATMGVLTAKDAALGRGIVFTCGSPDWSHGLSPHDGTTGTPEVKLVTLNVLKWLANRTIPLIAGPDEGEESSEAAPIAEADAPIAH